MLKYALLALATTAALTTPAMAKTSLTPATIATTINAALQLAPSHNAVAGLAGSNQIKVHHQGAAFIKVHFSDFNLPDGAYVTVSDPANNEIYRYDGKDSKNATYSSAAGENGLNQFSALSVFGDTALVTLVMPANAVWRKQHGIKIDRFNAGSNDEDIAQQQRLAPEFSTCGVNERKDVACWQSTHPTEYERTRPVARLLMNGSGLCTGWRVGNENHMFTNNHCVDVQNDVTNTEVWFNYQRSACGGSTNAQVVKVTGKDLLKTNNELDYSLFTVNDFASIASFGHFGLDNRPPSLGELIYIAQHGAGNPKELAIESDQNTSGQCQIDTASMNGRGVNTDTGYLCDTIGGSSGSPVIASSSNKVIALHHFGGCENQGVRIDKIWPQVSSYFGGVVPQGDGGPVTNQPPVAQMDISCKGLTCQFDGSGSVDVDGNITIYAWAFGDNTNADGITSEHTYSAPGAYEVSLKVLDDDGDTHTLVQDLTVTAGNDVDIQLFDNTPVTNQSGDKDQETVYYYETNGISGSLTVTLSGGTGDADLYVKRGSVPTKTDYDCRPYKTGNNETCSVVSGSTEKVYVKLIGYSAYSGASLVASVLPTEPPTFPVPNLTATTDNWQYFSHVIPTGQTAVTVNISGGTGDADLYVNLGMQPTKSTYFCRPYKVGNSETCTVTVKAGDRVYIGINAYSSYSGVTLDLQ